MTLLGVVTLQIPLCYAQKQAQPVDQQALMALAKQFVNTVGVSLKHADEELAKLDPDDMRMQSYFESIPDGEPMILQINLSKNKNDDVSKIIIEQPVAAVKQGYDVMVSLADFISAAGFPIKISLDNTKVDGWYIRQNQTFHLDMTTRKAVVNNRSFDVSDADVSTQTGEIMVRGRTLAQWFDFNLITNPQTQNLEILTAQKWPIQEKMERQERDASRTLAVLPKQPFRDDPYQLVSTPNADISLRHALTKTAGQKALMTTNYTVQAGGDLLGHVAKTTFSGTDTDKLTSISSVFSKTSEKNDLLGFMKAKYYEFNDVSTVNVPFAGPAPIERGIRATNKDPYTTYDTTTQIEGTAIPGWDVELYRDQQYLDTATVGGDGHYIFTKVTLFAGENRLRIIQYGPQGEITEESKTLSVSPSTYGAKGLYNISLSQQNTQTYTKFPSTDKDKNTPHLSGTYQSQLTNNLALQGGIQARQEGGHNNAYLHNGLVYILQDTILNADAVEASNGSYMGALTARRNFGYHHGSSSLRYTSENFAPDSSSTNTDTPATYNFSGEVTGPVFNDPLRNTTYDVNADLSQNSRGDSSLKTGLNLTTVLSGLFISNALNYSAETHGGTASGSSSSLQGVFSLRGRALGMTWRTAMNYDVIPAYSLRKSTLNLTRSLTQNLQSELNINHDFDPNYTSGELSMNWNHDKFIFSPTLSYDSNQAASLLMNLRFGLARNPYTGDISIKGTSVGDKGGISAFVYLDKNGDNKFSKGDEPLEDVAVESVQNQIAASTDKSGYAFLSDLPPNKITDIVVQESSAFDVNWVSGMEGISMRPRPGHVTHIDFPIHRGGEMGGTAYVITELNEPRPLRDMPLRLYNDDGRMVRETTTAPDGYYLFEKIPPGHYYMIADAAEAQASHIRRPLPQEIKIGFEGAVLAKQDIAFEVGDIDAGLSIAPDLSDYLDANPDADISVLAKPSVVLNFGDYNSRLLMALTWYNLKTRYGGLLAGAKILVKSTDSNVSLKTGKNTLRVLLPDSSMAEAHQRCQRLAEKGFTCTVELLPHGVKREMNSSAKRDQISTR
jgi:hypothetical protein